MASTLRAIVLADDDGPILKVEAVMDYRVSWAPRTTGQGPSGGKRCRNGRTRGEYFVRWKGLSAEHASWEPDTDVVDGSRELVTAFWQARAVPQPVEVTPWARRGRRQLRRGADAAS
jgi:hypothetical protein